MSTPSLFPESQEQRLQRLDAEILNLIMGHAGGPLQLTLGDDERAVLQMIRYRRGLKNAVTIREIQERTRLDPRAIKLAVRTLRMSFRLPVASWKHADRGGYYLIVDDADRAAWVKDVTDQVRAEVAVLNAAAGTKAGLELLGQLQLEIREEASDVRM